MGTTVSIHKEATPKELKYLRWCIEGAKIFSTCGKAQYMAIIIDHHGRIVSTGYNGSPSGFPHCNEGACPRFLNGTPAGESYMDCVSIHAEMNAIAFGDSGRFHQATMVVNGLCCWDCAKVVAGSGITRLVCLAGREASNNDAIREFLETAGIDLVETSLLTR